MIRKLTILSLSFVLFSCFNEPKKEIEKNNLNNSVNTNLIENEIVYEEPLKVNTKYIYIEFSVSKPVLVGIKSQSIDFPNQCHVDYEKEYRYTDIIEVNEYNDDVKYKLLDEAEKKISIDMTNNLYANAVVEYGSRAAENIKNEVHMVKVIDYNFY